MALRDYPSNVLSIFSWLRSRMVEKYTRAPTAAGFEYDLMLSSFQDLVS